MLAPLSETLAAKDPALTAYIFTDGWEFHAKTLTEDTQKRQSLMNEGFRVWSLTWQDLQSSSGDRPSAYGDTLLVASNLKQAERFWLGVFGKKVPIHPKAFVETWLTPEQTSWHWLTAWLLDPCGFTEGMRAAMQYVAFSQVARPAPAPAAGDYNRYPAPLTLAQPGKIIGWLPGAHPLDSAVWAAVLEQTGPEDFAIAAALRICAADFAGDRVVQDAKKHEAWSRFWQTANAQQFLSRSWICTEANETAPVNTHGYEPRDVVRPSVPETAGIDADWAEWLQELASDPEFFVHILPPARQLAQQHLPVPDDLVDGCAGRVFCNGQAFLWHQDTQSVLLVAFEDLTPGAELPKDNAVTVVTTADADWLTKLTHLITH